MSCAKVYLAPAFTDVPSQRCTNVHLKLVPLLKKVDIRSLENYNLKLVPLSGLTRPVLLVDKGV